MNGVPYEVAVATRALDGAAHCGDQGEYWTNGRSVTLCMVDGLGHGEQAEKAAKAALDFVARNLREPLPTLFRDCDLALRHTRGVAMVVALADYAAGTLTYAGVGNIHGMIFREGKIRLSSYNGIVGGGYKSLKTETIPLEVGDLVILLTDGVSENVDITIYDDVLRAATGCLAGKILDDWRCGRDDAGIIIYRNG